MKNRSPIAVAVLTLVTFGIYGVYWQVTTKGEMNKLGADIPTAWLIVVPFVSIWWLWKYSEGVEKVTGGKLSGVLAFVLLWLAGVIGCAIVQDSFNKVNGAAPAPFAGAAPAATATPTPLVGGETAAQPAANPPVVTPTPPADQPPTNPIQ